MSQEPTELQLLKYWLDAEISLLHIMFAVVVWLLTENIFIHVALAFYMFITFVYLLVRLAYVAKHDPKFLKVPKQS